ncbi:hypothetical protein [Richelia intracellularis]|uniref:hypothetical protein n=1 Tax=Richelia intracellularis TaxID=1164990 RepID=UPI000346F710
MALAVNRSSLLYLSAVALSIKDRLVGVDSNFSWIVSEVSLIVLPERIFVVIVVTAVVKLSADSVKPLTSVNSAFKSSAGEDNLFLTSVLV